MLKMKELEDESRKSHMNREVNVNLDGGEPKEEAPHFPRKLEAGLCLQICGRGKDLEDISYSSSLW